MQKAVIITGVSGDIGGAIAKAFDEDGYVVVGTYFNSDSAVERLADELNNDSFFYKYDLRDSSFAENFVKELESLDLTYEVLINNAGASLFEELRGLTIDKWNDLWNLNVTSTLFLSKAITPLFLKGGKGHIINISSVWGECGASMEVAYSTTKGAINAFTKAYAKEMAPSHIQVNAISPGFIDTKMNARIPDDVKSTIIEEIPADRLGTPKDVADATLALTKAGEYITGQVINVDGGWQV
ncbi:MAG: SDR family oxidoreductase [Eubacterium sp.]|nr:SDR family oxidoreductase [Eubacterium sp.]